MTIASFNYRGGNRCATTTRPSTGDINFLPGVFVHGTRAIPVNQWVFRDDARRIFCLCDPPPPGKIYAPATIAADFFPRGAKIASDVLIFREDAQARRGDIVAVGGVRDQSGVTLCFVVQLCTDCWDYSALLKIGRVVRKLCFYLGI